MKKEKREIKKLTLNKETIQTLRDTSLAMVAGGIRTQPILACIYPPYW